MPRKKQGLRSYHHKSRNGCSQCKRRRVKCSMQAPACANCIRRNETCEYAGMVDVSTAVVTPWHQGAAHGTSYELPGISFDHTPSIWTAPAKQASFPDRVIGPNNSIATLLESLMGRSWFTPLEAQVWSKAITHHAVKHPYLQHCIFSVAYLRRDLLDDPSKCSISPAAYEHQMAASALFRQGATPVGPNNWVAILSFHVFMLVFEFGSQSVCPDDQYNLIDTLRVLRSSHAIEEAAKPYFRASHFWHLISKRTQAETYVVDESLQANLLALERVIANPTIIHSGSAIVNLQALAELRRWVFSCDAHPRRWDQYCDWPGHLESGFLDLLANGDDVSLLLLIHWTAVLYRSPKPAVYSWAKRTAKYAVEQLNKRGLWQDLLFWPLCILNSPRMRTLNMNKHKRMLDLNKCTEALNANNRAAPFEDQPTFAATSVATSDSITSTTTSFLNSDLTIRCISMDGQDESLLGIASGAYESDWPNTFCPSLATSTLISTASLTDSTALIDPLLLHMDAPENTYSGAWQDPTLATSMSMSIEPDFSDVKIAFF